MGTQNLVSGVFSTEQSTSIDQALVTIKNGLPMLIILQPGQKKEFVKVGNSYLPLIELAHNVVTEHPELMSGVFDKAEFDRDYNIARDLITVLNRLEELTESVQDTIFAANSDAMSAALEVYAAVQQNKDKIPGLDTVAAKMAAFFKKSRRLPANTAPAGDGK